MIDTHPPAPQGEHTYARELGLLRCSTQKNDFQPVAPRISLNVGYEKISVFLSVDDNRIDFLMWTPVISFTKQDLLVRVFQVAWKEELINSHEYLDIILGYLRRFGFIIDVLRFFFLIFAILFFIIIPSFCTPKMLRYYTRDSSLSGNTETWSNLIRQEYWKKKMYSVVTYTDLGILPSRVEADTTRYPGSYPISDDNVLV